MQAQFLSWLLKDRLKNLLSSFSSANLDIQLRNGVLRLHNFSLAAEAFSCLFPPSLEVKVANVAELEVLLPWRETPVAPLVLRLHGVRIVIGPSDATRSAELDEWLHAQKMRLLCGLSAKGTTSTPPTATASGPPLTIAQIQVAIDALLRDLQVNVTDVEVVFAEAASRPAMRLSLLSLQMRCQRKNSLPRLCTILLGRQFASLLGKCGFAPPKPSDEHECSWTVSATVGVTWCPSGVEPTASSYGSKPDCVLEELQLKCEVGMRIDWPDAGTEGLAPRVNLDGTVNVGSAQVALKLEQLGWAASMRHRIEYAGHFWRYASLRPHTTPSGDAAGWWHYALAAVLLDVADRRRVISWRWLQEVARLELWYEAHLRSLDSADPPSEPPAKTAVLTEEAERRLDLQLLLQLRERVLEDHRIPRATPHHMPLELAVTLRTELSGVEVRFAPSARDQLIFTMGPLTADIQASVGAAVNQPLQCEASCSLSISTALFAHRCAPPNAEPFTEYLLSQPAEAQGLNHLLSAGVDFGRRQSTPQWQMTGVISIGGDDAPPQIGLALCSKAPLTICVDWGVLQQLASFRALLLPQPPSRLVGEPLLGGAPPDLQRSGRDSFADRCVNVVAAGAPRPQLSLQMDVCAPILLLVLALEEPALSVPLAHISRVHVHVLPPPASAQQARLDALLHAEQADVETAATILWSHIDLRLALAPQSLLARLLRPRSSTSSASSRSPFAPPERVRSMSPSRNSTISSVAERFRSLSSLSDRDSFSTSVPRPPRSNSESNFFSNRESAASGFGTSRAHVVLVTDFQHGQGGEASDAEGPNATSGARPESWQRRVVDRAVRLVSPRTSRAGSYSALTYDSQSHTHEALLEVACELMQRCELSTLIHLPDARSPNKSPRQAPCMYLGGARRVPWP